MAWEYLNEEVGRAEIISTWLIRTGLIEDAIIVDLACGVSSLVKYLKNFKHYYGNDISEEFINKARSYNIPNTTFDIKPSRDVHHNRIDVLILMGASLDVDKTAVAEFIRLVLTNKPKLVVFEGTNYFERVAGIFSMIKCFMHNTGYILDLVEGVIINSKFKNVWHRTILCFKRI